MGLLAPWFLAGLGLLALPVYLHLLKRHRSQRLPFSSLMFFERSMQADLRHRRLDFLTLLCVRLALLALLIFAFARPFLWRDAAPTPAARRLVVIDDSASMGYSDRMERARDLARPLLDETAKLAVFDSQLHFIDRAELSRLSSGTSRSSLGELARALRAYQQTVNASLEVHLIGDLQRSSMPPAFSDLRLGPGSHLTLHPIDSQTRPNFAVTGVSAPARVRDSRAAKVEATLAGFHTAEARLTVHLEINGRSVQQKPVELPAGGRARVEFRDFDLAYGFSRCAVVIDSHDELPVDDRYLFAIERTDPRRVVFLQGAAAGRSALYFGAALEAAAPGSYRLEVAPPSSLPVLEGAAFIVLADAAAIDDRPIARYVEAGGGALITLGALSAASGRIPILANKLSPTAACDEVLGEFDTAYPALAKAGGWEGIRFHRTFSLDPASARVVARFSSGAAALLEQRVGEGSVIVLASALDGVAGNLPLQPAFIPFVEQIARRLSLWDDAALDVPVDTVLDFGTASGPKAFEALAPDGRRALSLEESAAGARLSVSRAGFWEVRRGAGRTQMIAANIDRRESDLEPMPADSAELWSNPAEAAANAAAAPERARRSLDLWFLAAALLAAGFELWLASKHLTREAA